MAFCKGGMMITGARYRLERDVRGNNVLHVCFGQLEAGQIWH